MNLPARVRASRQKVNASFHAFWHRMPPEDVAQIWGGLPSSHNLDLGWVFSLTQSGEPRQREREKSVCSAGSRQVRVCWQISWPAEAWKDKRRCPWDSGWEDEDSIYLGGRNREVLGENKCRIFQQLVSVSWWLCLGIRSILVTGMVMTFMLSIKEKNLFRNSFPESLTAISTIIQT